MNQRFNHDCDRCKFIGQDNDYDVWICGDGLTEARTIILRYGNDGQYKSGTLFECVDLTEIDLYALYNGLELTEYEEKRLFNLLVRQYDWWGKTQKLQYNIAGSLQLGKGNVMFRD